MPHRHGIATDAFTRLVDPLDHARLQALRRADDRATLDGQTVVWYGPGETLTPATFAIQPGVADDLPSLLSSLAPEIGWPGAPPPPVRDQADPAQAIALWARVWQVREQADLRLVLWWDEADTVRASARLVPLAGERRLLADAAALVALLDAVARAPVSSTSPFGLLLAANRAADAGDYATARAAYERVLPELPHHAEAQRNYAVTLARLGEWEAATAAMRQALALAPDDPALAQEYLALETDAGIQAVQAGDDTRANGHFLRILERWPAEPTALANLASLRVREGRRREAQAIVRRFLRLHPTHPAAKQLELLLRELDDDEKN